MTYCRRPVSILYPVQFACYNVEGLFPGYSLKPALAPVLWIPLTVWVEVHSLHRVPYPVRGVHPIADSVGVVTYRKVWLNRRTLYPIAVDNVCKEWPSVVTTG